MNGEARMAHWREAWQRALGVWSQHLQLSEPLWCYSMEEAREQGLTQSFAAIRLHTQRVLINLRETRTRNIDDLATEILAHEIGHHVYAPANMTQHLQLLCVIRQSLPTLEAQAPLVANLYTDLLINHHLQRRCNLSMAELYRRLITPSSGQPSQTWGLYMRIYECLWLMPGGSLGGYTKDDAGEGDAWLGAGILKVYGKDWLTGASRFASLLLPYLVDDQAALRRQFGPLVDMEEAGRDCPGAPLVEVPHIPVVHPSRDPALGGQAEPSSPAEGSFVEPAARSGSQSVEPQEYTELLAASGLRLSEAKAAIRYYREKVRTIPIRYPSASVKISTEPELEGYTVWEPGEPAEAIDWVASASLSRTPVPGLTTLKRVYNQTPEPSGARQPYDLDLYVDCSGSMPNPQRQLSYPALAGAVLCLAALRSGARVQACLWSGARQCLVTEGFVRDERQLLGVLTGYFGGGTSFPIHRLRETYAKPMARPTHIVVLSDEGVSTLFEQDDQGNEGADISARALKHCGGAGHWVLDMNLDLGGVVSPWQERWVAPLRLGLEQGWQLHQVAGLPALLEFARAFAQDHYGPRR
ncbi:hypothetical protein [Marinimicrobium locisalis]|uniref:hypothetical protein n=1 Tax=Marinimicrobium locisalis TaxID=546022 RepID=UPI003221FDB5